MSRRGIPNKTLNAERFWGKVRRLGLSPGACWEWHGYTDPSSGYGRFGTTRGPDGTSLNRVVHFRAHRFALEMESGPIRADHVVLHICDNRVCVNPAHLRPGPQRENVLDCHAKGRSAIQRGKHNERVKLTDTQLVEIRRRYGLREEAHAAIAADFGISASHVGNIGKGRRRAAGGEK